MLPPPQTEIFTFLDELSLDEPSGKPLDALESVFQCSRSFSGGLEAFTQELLQLTFWQSQDYPVNPYKNLCLGLAAEIDRCCSAAGYTEPAIIHVNTFKKYVLLSRPFWLNPSQKQWVSGVKIHGPYPELI